MSHLIFTSILCSGTTTMPILVVRKLRLRAGKGALQFSQLVCGTAGQGTLVDPSWKPVPLITAKSCFKGSAHPRESSHDEEAPLKEQVCGPSLGRAGRGFRD